MIVAIMGIFSHLFLTFSFTTFSMQEVYHKSLQYQLLNDIT